MEIDKIYLGDWKDLITQIPDGSIDCIMTDPPYVINRSAGGGSVNNIKKLDKSLEQLDYANLRNGYDMETFAKEVERVQGGKINAYIWCNKSQIADYFRIYVGQMGCKYELICWHKQNALPTYSNKYLSDTEYCLYFHTGGFTHPQSYNDAKTYDVGFINHKDKKLWRHPTIKPLDIVRRLIRNSTTEGQTVLDPFIGSGTTGVACINENRHFVGFELNEDYFKIANTRIANERRQLSLFTDISIF